VTARRKGLAVAAIHVLLVASLGGKYLVDRMTRPRVWARAVPIDPELPLRGRYVRINLAVEGDHLVAAKDRHVGVELRADGTRLVGAPTMLDTPTHVHSVERGGELLAVLDEPVAYFIPDAGPDPSRGLTHALWVEVTVPRRGLPRPIRLGVSQAGSIVPLEDVPAGER
jgi:hypothetical protein